MGTRSEERIVVLTGANEGIGYNMLTALIEDGHRVAALDINGDTIRDVRDRSPEQVLFYQSDVSDTDDVRTAITSVIDQWGRIDILVNNAAVATFAPFDDRTIAGMRREFEVNFFGSLRLIRAVLPHMRARDDGIIHNMGSGTGDVGHPGLAGYSATKGAIKALTHSLRLELRHTGVSCTLMVPPTTNTRMSAELGYPTWMTVEPEEVGRKLAHKIDSTGPVITPDWKTTLGLSLIQRFPSLWERMTERFVDLGESRTGGQ